MERACAQAPVLLTAAQPIWSLPLSDAYAALQSGPEGLSSAEAAARLERYGANRLPPLKRRPLLLRFTDQLIHFMALLLWVAGGLAFIARAPQLGWAIWAVILINALFSFWQEFKAERTLQALAGNLPPLVRVWRDGQVQQRSADQLYVDLSVLTGDASLRRRPVRRPCRRPPSRISSTARSPSSPPTSTPSCRASTASASATSPG